MYTCGKCKSTHTYAWEARNCYGLGPFAQASAQTGMLAQSAPTRRADAATESQISYVDSLLTKLSEKGADTSVYPDAEFVRDRYSKSGASSLIDRLKKALREAENMTSNYNAPNRGVSSIPIDMLKSVPDGYYAVRPDSITPYTFFRVSRPKSGRYAGTVKVQTQHGEDYKLAFVIWNPQADQPRITVYNTTIEDKLLLLVVDPNGAHIAYGQEIGRCCICGKELTDERSRYFGIGPDCETRHGYIVDQVIDQKGPFTFGQ